MTDVEPTNHMSGTRAIVRPAPATRCTSRRSGRYIIQTKEYPHHMTTVHYFDPDLALEPCLNTCLNTCFPVSSLGVSTPVLVSQHLILERKKVSQC